MYSHSFLQPASAVKRFYSDNMILILVKAFQSRFAFYSINETLSHDQLAKYQKMIFCTSARAFYPGNIKRAVQTASARLIYYLFFIFIYTKEYCSETDGIFLF